MNLARRSVRCDEIAKGGFHFTSSDVFVWHDGIKNLRHFVPFAQNDWAKHDDSGASTLSFPFDSGTGRISAELNPSSAGVHKIRKRILLPRDFGAFAPTVPMEIVVQRSGAVTAIKATLWLGATADPGINGVAIDPAVASTWESFILIPTGSYNPGDFVTFEVEYDASTNGVTVDIADLSFAYKTNRGNI
jgi:hypothetical protein